MPPTKIFIVPYRNRPEQKFFFSKYMSFLLEHMTDYEIYFSHQADERSFNRGATKNIGFLAMKNKYPNDYKNITFIFNDLDTLPFNRIFDYETTQGIVKHYYGFEHSLGGIVVIKGSDFEKINGYPNFWSWGLEDSCLQKRCLDADLKIDRSNFYKIGSPEMLQLFDGVQRLINKKDPHKLNSDLGKNGLHTIHKLDYSIDKTSKNDKDNIFQGPNENMYYINISMFLSETRFEDDEYFIYDLREPTKHITQPDARRRTNKVLGQTNEWSNIPYYPTVKERKEIAARPSHAIRQQQQPHTPTSSHRPHPYPPSPPPPPNQLHTPPPQTYVNIFSQEYARRVQSKPLATKSANIGLGGVRYR